MPNTTRNKYPNTSACDYQQHVYEKLKKQKDESVEYLKVGSSTPNHNFSSKKKFVTTSSAAKHAGTGPTATAA